MVHRVEEVVDVAVWRAEIRRQARADKINVRTGVNGGLVWALRLRREHPCNLRDIHRFRDLLSHVVPLALELGHEPSVILWDGDEVLCACDRCSARGYGDTADDVMGGALFEDECPNEAPPKITALSWMYVAGSLRPSPH